MVDLAAMAPLLPHELLGAVTAVEPISMGLSGAGVYAVTSARGEIVLRVASRDLDDGDWRNQLRALRRAAEHGVAPPLIHIDEAARATVSARAPGRPLPEALADPAQRAPAIAGIVAQLRTLHALDASGIVGRDSLAYLRDRHAVQRQRPGFPVWAQALDEIADEIDRTLQGDDRRVLSHNDVNPGNVLWDGTRAWLVDWDVAGLNHPFYDLATLAMFLQLDGATADALLALQEGVPVDDGMRGRFAALRRLAALLCGVIFLSMVGDLSGLPASAPTLTKLYAGMRNGALDLRDATGQGAFALALLRLGCEAPA